MSKRDVFDHKASCIVEEHIRVHGEETALGGIKSPDRLKDAIAAELRLTWNDAIDAASNKARSIFAAYT